MDPTKGTLHNDSHPNLQDDIDAQPTSDILTTIVFLDFQLQNLLLFVVRSQML